MTTTTTMPNVNAVQGGNPLKGLLAYGQSPWLDFIRRNILLNGDLKKMIADDGLRGMTSNPAIFEKAITAGDDYKDIINAPDAQSAYEQVAEAYIAALEARAAKGEDVSHIASVASFFVSRIDSLVDSKIDAMEKNETDSGKKSLLESLRGKVAIANARRTYAKYQELVGGPRWKALAGKGAQTQRLLWASTSTKNPKYRDVLYVEELIGADTVDTIPPATFDAFREHGKLRNSLTENVAGAHKTMSDLEAAGISMKGVTDKLIADAVKLFQDPFKQLLDAITKHAGVHA